MSETKRNIAVSGVDTQKKYDNVCTICGDISAYHNYINDYSIVYDHTEKSGFMHNWEPQEYSHCTLYTYEEFIEKFGEKEMSEKICVTGYGQTVYFKKPTFNYAQMCIGSDNLIHGQVLNTKQDKWKLKKWNKETGKVVGSGRNTATYFDLVPISYIEAIEESTKKTSIEILSEIKKITESESSATKETVECDGKWNGHYTDATEEAYTLLVADGYKPIGEFTYKYELHDVYITTNDSKIWGANSSEIKNEKPFYIVDGELSATQYSPSEVGFKSYKEEKVSDAFLDCDIEDLPNAFVVTEDESYKYESKPCKTFSFSSRVHSVTNSIAEMLIEKNEKYGNSALEPKRIFSKMDSIEQLYVRIDDKLSRIANQNLKDDEDVIEDLIGYLILLKIAKSSVA